MDVPQLGVARHLGGAGELVGAGAQEVASFHVLQCPPAAVIFRYTATMQQEIEERSSDHSERHEYHRDSVNIYI